MEISLSEKIINQKECQGTCSHCSSKATHKPSFALKNTGIWLDFKAAYVIHLRKGEVVIKYIKSNIDASLLAEEVWFATACGTEDLVPVCKKHQIKAYFDKIMDATKTEDFLYIFGAIEAVIDLQKQMEKNKDFLPKIKAVQEAANSLDDDKIAAVKAFFYS